MEQNVNKKVNSILAAFAISAIIFVFSYIALAFSYGDPKDFLNPVIFSQLAVGIVIRLFLSLATIYIFLRNQKNPFSNKTLKIFVFAAITIAALCFFVAITRAVLSNLIKHNIELFEKIFYINQKLLYFPASECVSNFISLGIGRLIKNPWFVARFFAVLADAIFFFLGIFKFANFASSLTPSNKENKATRSSFKEAIHNCFYKYFYLDGRATRSEFWFFTLFVLLLGLIPGVLLYASFALYNQTLLEIMFALLIVIIAVTFIPSCSVAIRRAHDAGFAGIYAFIPILNYIIMLLPSDKENSYDNESQVHAGAATFAKILIVILLAFIVIYLSVNLYSIHSYIII